MFSQIKELPIAKILNTKLCQFKEAIPFMVKLKNKALRQRHWNLLMNKTGHTFDVLVDFALSEMFLMKLYQHRPTVLEIINTAVNEVVIEAAVDDLITKWNSMTFTLQQHLKGQIERG